MNPQELRELDAWISEHVMGWKPVAVPGQIEEGTFFVHGPDVLVPGTGNSLFFFSPTTDPAAAMMVLDKCRCVDSVHIMPPTPDAPCEIWGVGSRAKADTLPLAICLFAKNLFSK